MKLFQYQIDFLIRESAKRQPKKRMIPAEMKLVAICDELLAATGNLRSICETMGAPWDKSAAAKLINRLLDIRNEVSPPAKADTAKK
jgi:hypothetical protein